MWTKISKECLLYSNKDVSICLVELDWSKHSISSHFSFALYDVSRRIETNKQFLSEDELNWDPVLDKKKSIVLSH